MKRRAFIQASAALAVGVSSFVGHAQDKFPSRPITLIAPWPPGGSSDAVMRALGESASRALGVPVVVDNKPGAGGTLGANAMVNAKPDGYTLTQLPLGVYRIPHMQKTQFDPLKDLTHIVCLTGYTFGLAAVADAPFKSLKEMVAYARANPGKVTYGHTGIGTTPHLAMEEFSNKAGIELLGVPYKGSAEIIQAILGNQIMMMSGTPEFAPHVRSNKLRLLATLGRERTKAFPEVPTVKESGWDTISESPFGIGGPANMPPAVVKTLHDAFKSTLTDPKVIERFEQFFQPTIYMGTEDYTAYAKRTFEAERATIQRLGLAKAA
jgi:tripartite-type tricarboxylate transporter receptor subunit TctC